MFACVIIVLLRLFKTKVEFQRLCPLKMENKSIKNSLKKPVFGEPVPLNVIFIYLPAKFSVFTMALIQIGVFITDICYDIICDANYIQRAESRLISKSFVLKMASTLGGKH